MPETPLLREPLDASTIRARLDEYGYVTGCVAVETDEMIEGDLESFLDLISERLVGSSLGMDLSYRAVGVDDGDVVFEVTLDPSAVLDEADRS